MVHLPTSPSMRTSPALRASLTTTHCPYPIDASTDGDRSEHSATEPTLRGDTGSDSSDAAGSTPPAPPAHPLRDAPCAHNAWDDVRTRKGAKVLRCRECQRQWKLRSGCVPRCIPFLHGECMLRGAECPYLHVHKRKECLDDRVRRFGSGLLTLVPQWQGQEDAAPRERGPRALAAPPPPPPPPPAPAATPPHSTVTLVHDGAAPRPAAWAALLHHPHVLSFHDAAAAGAPPMHPAQPLQPLPVAPPSPPLTPQQKGGEEPAKAPVPRLSIDVSALLLTIGGVGVGACAPATARAGRQVARAAPRRRAASVPAPAPAEW